MERIGIATHLRRGRVVFISSEIYTVDYGDYAVKLESFMLNLPDLKREGRREG